MCWGMEVYIGERVGFQLPTLISSTKTGSWDILIDLSSHLSLTGMWREIGVCWGMEVYIGERVSFQLPTLISSTKTGSWDILIDLSSHLSLTGMWREIRGCRCWGMEVYIG